MSTQNPRSTSRLLNRYLTKVLDRTTPELPGAATPWSTFQALCYLSCARSELLTPEGVEGSFLQGGPTWTVISAASNDYLRRVLAGVITHASEDFVALEELCRDVAAGGSPVVWRPR